MLWTVRSTRAICYSGTPASPSTPRHNNTIVQTFKTERRCNMTLLGLWDQGSPRKRRKLKREHASFAPAVCRPANHTNVQTKIVSDTHFRRGCGMEATCWCTCDGVLYVCVVCASCLDDCSRIFIDPSGPITCVVGFCVESGVESAPHLCLHPHHHLPLCNNAHASVA